jgi:2-amino-4-hydroxy-6-hydroxymethyldihydropteridine diphosphokinase
LTRAYVGLGANLGPREVTLLRAVDLLAAEAGVEVLEVSGLRETAPVGNVYQPEFLNGAVAVETSLSARELLDALLRVERELGRVRDGTQWGPRTIDLDLLVYGDEIIDEPELRVPHPRLHERRFALEPLAELEPELRVPGRGPISELLAAVDARPEIHGGPDDGHDTASDRHPP